MARKEELLSVFEDIDGKDIISKLIDDMIYLEGQLEQLRKLPMIKVNPNNPEMQKTTPAAKLYKEFLGQYNVTIKSLGTFIKKTESNETSPLEEYLRNLD